MDIALNRTVTFSHDEKPMPRHLNGKLVESIELVYTFRGCVFDNIELDGRQQRDWHLCPHVRLSQIVRLLHPDALEHKHTYTCKSCLSGFTRFVLGDDTFLIVRQDLGYGRIVPDAPWLTAIGTPPISNEALRPSKLFRRKK